MTLLHVQDAERIEPHLQDKLEEFNRIDNESLQAIADDLKGVAAGVDVDTVVTYGRPLTEILRSADSREASLIVMATHGRGMLAEGHLGNVSQAVIRKSKIPVLIVPSRR